MNNTNDMINLYKQHILEFTNTALPNVVTHVIIDHVTFDAFKQFGDTTDIISFRKHTGFKFNGCFFLVETYYRQIRSMDVHRDNRRVDNRNLLSYEQFCKLHEPVEQPIEQPVQHIQRVARPPRTLKQSIGDLFRAIHDTLIRL